MSHHTGAGHPECAERLSVTMEHLSALPLYDELKHYEPLPVEQELIEANHSSRLPDPRPADLRRREHVPGQPGCHCQRRIL